MQISIVTDEISADFETAVELGLMWGVHAFELRGFGEKRVPLLSDYQKTRVREVLEEHNANLVAISPGLFKFPFPEKNRNFFPVRAIDHEIYQGWQDGREQLRYHLEELLPQSIEYAKEVDVDLIISFGFHRGGDTSDHPPAELVGVLRQAAEMVEAADMRLALEVEDQFWPDTGEHTANIIQQVDHPALVVNWDPGNVVPAGDIPYPEGYRFVRDYVDHVHFKDITEVADTSFEYRVHGDINWQGQMQALADDGYGGYISVETHMIPKVQTAEAVTNRLKNLLQSVETA